MALQYRVEAAATLDDLRGVVERINRENVEAEAEGLDTWELVGLPNLCVPDVDGGYVQPFIFRRETSAVRAEDQGRTAKGCPKCGAVDSFIDATGMGSVTTKVCMNCGHVPEDLRGKV